MQRFKKIIRRLLIFCLLVCGILAVFYYGHQRALKNKLFNQRPSLVMAKSGTNTNPSWHSFAAYQKSLEKYFPFVAKNSLSVTPRTWVGKDVVIPGLVKTRSYDFKTKKMSVARNMTPQGLTIAGKYLLISAYDGQKRHASVIYMLDKKTGHYLKTIQVKGRPHLGGIAYDRVAKNVWFTGSLNGQSALMCSSLKSLEKYPAASSKPLEYKYKIGIPSLEKASTVTYYANQLFVGFFNMYGRGKVTSYTIKRNGKNSGSITNNEIKAVTGRVSWSDPNGQTSMDKQIQGLSFYQDKIFLSQSYGSKPSKLYVFPLSALKMLDEKNAELVIELPPYLEQISAYRGQLLCMFESGSKLYARPQIVIMDRILSLNINALFGH